MGIKLFKKDRYITEINWQKSHIIASVSFPQGTASEATLVALLGAKAKKLKQVKDEHPEWSDNEIIGKLVAYGSCEY